MRRLIVMGCALCWWGATTNATIFDEELYRSALDPEQCADQWKHMDRYQFYDASFRVPEGMTIGYFKDYGNFHQCLAINRNFHGRSVQGKYCVISAHLSPPIFRIPSLGGISGSNNLTWTEVKFSQSTNGTHLDANETESVGSVVVEPITLQLAVCVPRACTPDALLRRYADHPLVRFNYSLAFCRLPADKPYSAVDYVALFIFSLLALLTIISTTYELHHIYILKKEWRCAKEWACAFSLHRNTRLVLAAAPAHAPDSLPSLHGIRALSLLWIIIYHSKRAINKIEIMPNAIFARDYLWLFNAHFAVDTFFVLSGLLLVYTNARKPKSLGLRSLPMFYVSRYVRLFPVLAMSVLLQAAVVPRLVDGPAATQYAHLVERCRRYWWSALLYVQNIVNPQSCLGHSWYLSVDMQLYLVAPLVLFCARAMSAWRGARAAWLVLVAVVLATLAASLAFCFYYDFLDIGRFGVTDDYWSKYYVNTITRSPPFFIGMLVGYGLHVYRDEKLDLPKWSIFLWYSAALVLSSLAFFGYHSSTRTLWEDQAALNTKYALARSCWALALGWLVLACSHGWGGPVNWFLSLPLWQFVSRISYAMYMFSGIIQDATTVAGNAVHFDMESLLWKFSGDLVGTVVLAVAASVLVEAPLFTLYRLLLQPRAKQES